MQPATRATQLGRNPKAHVGTVNTPVYRASTILHPTLAEFRASRSIPKGEGITYGVHGTPGTFALEEAITELEGGFRTRLAPSGLAAISCPLLAYLGTGDHLLVADCVYGPTRAFCDGTLRRLGVETEYFDPGLGADVAVLFRPNTKALFLESPGSLTFEVLDVPAMAAAARAANVLTILDNTWATPLYFRSFDHGVDVTIHAVTKYIAGHSDLVMGTVTVNEAAYPALQRGWAELGICITADDAFLALRGLRSMPTRLAQHHVNGLRIANWLLERDEVAAVLHPAMPHDPGHALWQRDFHGASGLFSFALVPELSTEAKLAAMLDEMQLFGMGYSWGGYESLLIPIEPEDLRTASAWPCPGLPAGQYMRIHVGLEAPDDLMADLDAGFDRLRNA